MRKKIKKTITIPEKVKVELNLPKIIVKGPKGNIEKNFKIKNILIKEQEDKIVISCDSATKKDKKIMNTIASHITNMIKGVIDGFEYKLQICSIHFPINVKIDKEKGFFIIKNFIGENKDRVVKINPGVDVKVEGDIVNVNAIDKELAGQQAANIELATKIKRKDRRIFQDGIWIIKKEKGRSR